MKRHIGGKRLKMLLSAKAEWMTQLRRLPSAADFLRREMNSVPFWQVILPREEMGMSEQEYADMLREHEEIRERERKQDREWEEARIMCKKAKEKYERIRKGRYACASRTSRRRRRSR